MSLSFSECRCCQQTLKLNAVVVGDYISELAFHGLIIRSLMPLQLGPMNNKKFTQLNVFSL